MACVCGHGKENMEEYLAPLKKILEKYPGEERYLIPILQEAQEAYGYLPKDVLREIANYLGLSVTQVYGVVTFYTQFHLKPRGKNVIKVCTGTACHVRGAADVLQALENELGVSRGGTTEDLSFTLETVACIGACGLAPVIMINEDTHGRLTPDKIPAILDKYREQKETKVS
ncbi:MAG TPA: NADH-quinone oxidoreductase subunit NuoE [Halanaerobiaceae bacterium]|nr:NADH-quinone oxidoreductase subunit NuoE [Bacillota bacterium]HHU92193.1 NADH-quinone oxidoreductase subunit NuoE [Halanaerobiaceae bacterium]HOA41539.1 NADH-quinone oxidoreductase subunit NuoE [Halanaerobiales bacterium]HPZ63574.1 NADH-quinone oxidoreductase subunit NuoE [Halanaerobiales bacterium]HQD04900.1 NADH-quinone oxidoreductase subunit NuoE [Halanaerobiales bacterium]